MFGSEVIDVGIGMALLFLFMSLIATVVREVVESFVKSRSKDLEAGIRELLATSTGSSSSLVSEFYAHPVIAALYKGNYVAGGRQLPSYIPRQSFSLAVLDMIAKASETGTPLSIETLQKAMEQTKNPNAVQRIVLIALGTASGDLDRVRKALEDWYDGTMDRVSGWYTRRTGRILSVIGFGAAVFFNVDAITVAQHLIQDKSLRQAVVAEAEHTTGSPQKGLNEPGDPASSTGSTVSSSISNVEDLKSKLADIGFPIGWKAQGYLIYPGEGRARWLDASAGEPPDDPEARNCRQPRQGWKG